MTATQMQLEDWLDDICVRFIINLPQEDLSSVARICFQVEEAQWFYEDFIRPLDPSLPSMSLRTFCLRIFQHCPLLASFSVEHHTKAFEEFLQYKTRVPVRGAIMLNHAMDSVVLVKGWKKGASWSFPRGKINKDEDDLDCAVREVYEETGLDLAAAGLVPTEKKPKYVEISMREQQLRLYVFRDIPMDTKFQPRTRKEISKIQWYKLSELPAFRRKGAQDKNDAGVGPALNKFYMVAPFLVPLKKWIASQKKLTDKRTTSGAHGHLPQQVHVDEAATTEDDIWIPRHPEQQLHVPAIDTMDGATRELQRLLKMQPPTQGLQSPPQEDKGTALLSILQSNKAPPAPQAHQNAPMPHTPLDAITSEISPPRNPHHYSNHYANHGPSQQAPPTFPFAPDHQSFQVQQSHSDMTRHEAFSQQQLSWAHSQGLPHQAQGTLGQDAYLQDQVARQHVDTRLAHPPQPHHHAATAGQAPLPGQLPSQFPNQTLNAPGSAKLSGASLALLSAFKRDTGPTQNTQQPAQSAPAADNIDQFGAPKLPHYNQSVPINTSHEPRGVSTTRPPEQTHVSELVGSVVQPNGDPHRSALLGMFKKSPSTATANQPPGSGGGYPPQGQSGTTKQHAAQLGQAEEMLLQQLQGNRGPASQQLTLEQLSIQSKPTQPTVKARRGGDNRSPYQPALRQSPQRQQQQQQQSARSPFASSHGQQPHPPRILQRGQTLDDFAKTAAVQHRGMSPKSSPFASALAQGHSRPAAEPPLTGSTPDHLRRPGGAREQKQQLLSLFGKPEIAGNGAPVSGMEPGEGASLPRSRVSSMASRGGDTPISPAEQTFLLDYLQSATNNAGRR